MDDQWADLRLAVLLPCYNEGGAIRQVVEQFRAVLPTAEIYVFDNNSVDDTVAEARAAGAVIRHETHQGKGNVVRRMFSDVEADIYVMADGDGTYDAGVAGRLVDELVVKDLDLVVGARREAGTNDNQYRPGHRFGNRMLTGMVALLFGHSMTDVLSGYRVMSRRFVKSFPNMAKGFEIEIMMTIHALSLRLPATEVGTDYFDRAGGTVSKLHTIRDGLRIFSGIAYLFKEYRPLLFFGIWALVLATLGLSTGLPVVFEFYETGLVPRFPSAILATGLMILATISMTCGLILDTVSRGQMELKRIAYFALPAVSAVLRERKAGR